MNNIISYAKTFHHSFDEKPFSQVDSLVLSQLAYLRFEHCGLDKPNRFLQLGSLAAELRNQRLIENAASKSMMQEFMYALATNPRFRWLMAGHYTSNTDVQEDKQFSATTFMFEDGTIYVAFRGTDGTVVGWRENFNMTFMPVIPSQQAAAAYLESIAGMYAGTVYVGGHSKGGNLAVYAAACCSPHTQARIPVVFSHDGPGFQKEFFDEPGYSQIQSRIQKTVPESAIIGMLLQHQEPYMIIESTEHGIFQHKPFSWVVNHGQFSVKESISKSAQTITTSFNSLAETLDASQRKLIVDALFKVVSATTATTLRSLIYETLRNAPTVIKAISGIDPETKQLLAEKLSALEILVGQPKDDKQAQ